MTKTKKKSINYESKYLDIVIDGLMFLLLIPLLPLFLLGVFYKILKELFL